MKNDKGMFPVLVSSFLVFLVIVVVLLMKSETGDINDFEKLSEPQFLEKLSQYNLDVWQYIHNC